MKTTKKEYRQMGALKRLQDQLVSGVKNSKTGELPLTDGDKKRINAEIEILKTATKHLV